MLGNKLIKLEINGYEIDIDNVDKKDLINNVETAKKDSNDTYVDVGNVIIEVVCDHVSGISAEINNDDDKNSIYFIYDNGDKVSIVDKNNLLLIVNDKYKKEKELISRKDLDYSNIEICNEVEVNKAIGKDCDNVSYCIRKYKDNIRIDYYILGSI
jgi:hypothetical protein